MQNLCNGSRVYSVDCLLFLHFKVFLGPPLGEVVYGATLLVW